MPENSNYTCINTYKISVVDYFFTFQDVLKIIKNCEIQTMAEILAKFHIFPKLLDRRNTSDHSILSIDVTYDNYNSKN